MGIIIAALILGVVIMVHESGHFLMAKASGIVVEEFSIGMGPRLLSKVMGGTRYSLKLIPFGGSCMMKGEDAADDSEGTFNSKPVWKRIAVIFGGPFFNFILAFVGAMIIICTIGYDSPDVIQVEEGSPEASAGLQEGDLIREFNGKSINISRDLYTKIMMEGIPEGKNTMTVIRDGKKVELSYNAPKSERYMLGITYNATEEQAVMQSVAPGSAMDQAGIVAGDIITGIDGNEFKSGKEMGEYLNLHPLDGKEIHVDYLHDGLEYDAIVVPDKQEYVRQGFVYNMGREKTSFVGALKYSILEVKYWILSTLDGFKMIFTGRVGMDSVSGPIGVVNIIGDTYKESRSEGGLMTWMTMINMMILISSNLGVLNLIPFPALDGGRLVFLLIEAVRGKPVNREVEGTIHMVGFMLLMGFILFVTVKDVLNLF